MLHPADALEMLERTGVDAVAAARGVLGNPWFFRQVADLAAGRECYQPSVQEQRELLAWHFDHARRIYGDRAAKIMRKFGIKYARMHPSPAKVRAAFVRVSRRTTGRPCLRNSIAAGSIAGRSVEVGR